MQNSKTENNMISDFEYTFAMKAIRRKQSYLVISILSVVLGLNLSMYYAWLAYTDIEFNLGIHFILVLLILLNARQNLRQYSYAKTLEVIFTSTEYIDKKNIIE